ncbi:metallophosphoesterase family protein [Actinocorallia sp. A-T 12471]|uniref:metallophosphoesterase family protein n=1 Tax=Actinocorallia sp. A-T 12471 TaxID=3089813 RepID=UPI0029CDDB08|nr:metallophosphoesterase [Actinocorallia sp. A-T 12471]MDX6743189.1 metallophosphoesterase [Actinocorallia sp. A-T 12471]
MRIHVVSDVHGRADALARAGDGADALICLGDLILFVDYADPALGMFGELFGAEAAKEYLALRSGGFYDESRALADRLWATLDGDPRTYIDAAVRRQYTELFAAMPVPSYLTYGNVDVPAMWPEFVRAGQTVLDGQTVEIGGLTFGFVGGGLRTRYHTPNEIADEEFAAKVAAVGAVDVLCCHIPPAVPELLYDTVARRFERGSDALLEAVRETQPRYVLFGHVHQPLAARTRIGRTECVNVGHFRASGEPYVLRLEE